MKKLIASLCAILFCVSLFPAISSAGGGGSVHISETQNYSRELLSNTKDQKLIALTVSNSLYTNEYINLHSFDISCGPGETLDKITVKEVNTPTYYYSEEDIEVQEETIGSFTFSEDSFGQKTSVKNLDLKIPQIESKYLILYADTKEVDNTHAFTCRLDNFLIDDQDGEVKNPWLTLSEDASPFQVTNEDETVVTSKPIFDLIEPESSVPKIVEAGSEDVTIHKISINSEEPYTIDDIFFTCDSAEYISEFSIEGAGISKQELDAYKFSSPIFNHYRSAIFRDLNLDIEPEKESILTIKADFTYDALNNFFNDAATCRIRAINAHGDNISIGIIPNAKGTFDSSRFRVYEISHDVETSRYSSGIVYLLKNGIAAGYPDGNFYPEKPINRAELTKIIINAKRVYMSGPPPNIYISCSTYEEPFPDVDKYAWFKNYVCRASEDGWIEGYEDGFFRPASNVTRAESVKMIIASHKIPLLKSTGENNKTHWFYEYQATAEEIGLDFNDENFKRLDAPITRGEMSELINTTHKWLEDTPNLLHSDFITASDEFLNLVDQLESVSEYESFDYYSTPRNINIKLACENENFELLEEINNLSPEQEILVDNWIYSNEFYYNWLENNKFLVSVLIFEPNPFQTAIMSGCTDIVQQYIDDGTDVNNKDSINGYGAIHTAVNEDNLEMVTLLVENGADTNLATVEEKETVISSYYSKTPEGITPIVFAIVKKNLETAKYLLENGADPNASVGYLYSYTESEWFVLDVALMINHLDMIDLLREYGATETSLNETEYTYPIIPGM